MLTVAFYILIALSVAVAGLVAYAATRPDTFQVVRSINVAAPPDAIFPLINDLKALATWSPYERKDPDMGRMWSGPASGKGQRYDWDGDSKAGKGWLRIADSSAPSRVDIDLIMLKPMQATNRVTFTLVPDGETTKVTWAIQGQVPLVAKVVHLFFDMDRMCGDDFTVGLADLKTKVEGASVSSAAQS